MITDADWAHLLHIRATNPAAVRDAYRSRERRKQLMTGDGTLFLVAADHPARGALAIGDEPMAMANRRDLLNRLTIALSDPDVDGLLATPDIVEELLLLNRLHHKVIIGSMNRGGLAGASWEIDDRFTAYDVRSILHGGLDGGKMLLRIVYDDHSTAPTMQACSHAVSGLAEHGLMAMVEPLPYRRDDDGKLVLQTDAAALASVAGVASGLGFTSAYTWLKLPAPQDLSVLDATTLPVLILGGMPSGRMDDDLATWGRALGHPAVRGLVVGRSLLYPPDGDVAGAVGAAATVMRMAVNA
jgi:hypothetical protein